MENTYNSVLFTSVLGFSFEFTVVLSVAEVNPGVGFFTHMDSRTPRAWGVSMVKATVILSSIFYNTPVHGVLPVSAGRAEL